MDWLTLTGVKPYDGRYELDIVEQPLTTREWGWAKRYAGYASPLDMGENAFADPEMIGVLALVALHRGGKLEIRDVPELWERIQDAPFGTTIVYEGGSLEDEDASPPPGNSDVRPSSNGERSPTGSETSETHPSPTGSPPSDTSASVPVTSAT